MHGTSSLITCAGLQTGLYTRWRCRGCSRCCSGASSTGLTTCAGLQNTYALEVLWLFLVLLLLMCLGRAVFVFPLSWAHNWWSRERLSFRDSVIIWCVALGCMAPLIIACQGQIQRLRWGSANLPGHLHSRCCHMG